jgi:hypothetical protein
MNGTKARFLLGAAGSAEATESVGIKYHQTGDAAPSMPRCRVPGIQPVSAFDGGAIARVIDQERPHHE